MYLRKIWDGGVRFFHWSQLLLIVGLWWTAEQELFGLHMLQAYALLSLLGARIIWGFLGSETATFKHFMPTPTTLLRFLQQPQATVGHNPLSALMIVALLVAVLLQGFSGLMATDDLSAEGPLYSVVSSDLADFADSFHHWWFDIIVGLAVVHALAAIWHQLRGDKIITAMLTGKKQLPIDLTLQMKSGLMMVLLGVVLFVLCLLWQGDVLLSMVKSDAITLGWLDLPSN